MNNPTPAQMIEHLRQANQVAQVAMDQGHHPFGAVLVAPSHTTVLLAQGNVDAVNHAESTLIRRAYAEFEANFLWGCTLYTTVEPCAMCAGAQYWGNVGRLVYGVAEHRLLSLTGNHAANPTLNVPCRYVFDHGQKAIQVWGPIAAVEAEILALHQGFWQQQS